MDLFYKILALTLNLFLMFFLIRGIIRMYTDSILKKRDRKARAKGQSFLEWFFYKRYLDVLPKSKLIWYYSNFISYVISILTVVILTLIGRSEHSKIVVSAYFLIYAFSLLIEKATINVGSGKK